MSAMEPASGYVTVNGLKLHYLDYGGPGRAMLLLHGMPGNAHTWDTFAPAVRTKYRVIALDQRGRGDSQWADSYLDGEQASDAAGVIRSLGLGKAVVIGLHMGGRAALVLAARYPELVDKLFIVDVGIDLPADGVRRVQGIHQAAPAAFGSVEEAVTFIRGMSPTAPEERVRQQTLHNLRRRDDGKWEWKYDPRITRYIVRADREELWPILPGISCPTLIVRGADSDILTPEIALTMKGSIPESQLVAVPNAGHAVTADNPAGFEAAVKPFLGD